MANPKFTPTARDRELVELLAGCHVSQPDIARAILNPATRKPVSLSTLKESFREELKAGSARLRSLVFSQFVKKIKKGEWAALQFALRYLCGLNEQTVDKLGLGGTNLTLEAPTAEGQAIRVLFVKSNHKDDPPSEAPRLIEHRPLPSDDGKGPEWSGTKPRPTPTEPAPAPDTTSSKVVQLHRGDPANPEFVDKPSGRVSIFDQPKRGPKGQNWMS
jgi:hypothetical protein